MNLSHESAQQRMNTLGMDDIPLMEYTPHPRVVDGDWFEKYVQLRHRFMESLMDSIQELVFMNLSQDEVQGILMGRRLPANTSLRLRIPLTWGGDLTIDNMFMCRTFPHGQNMDRFIIEQTGNEKIWLPNPTKKVYVPAHTTSGGDGGNATSDRLSQMAAQLAQNNRGME